ncbi:MAG TPA: HIT domain-containing protein [Thermoanaerobaculia bacterium]
MHTLFTPWRYDYLVSPKSEEGCIFCNAATSQDPAQTLTLFRNDLVLVMLNRYPYTNGHLMVAPIRHEARLFDSGDPTLFAIIRITAEAQRILSDTVHPSGFNIGMNFGQIAGAGVADHYHVHVVPRWGGDVNFMTVTAETRLVPESLDATYRKLQPKFAALRVDLLRTDE